uniref:Uncharacterized protein n=1 Tax=viral metagenome TaxID=1070528 RepID=A0A6H1ZBI5_9ZZZZ
MAEITDTIVKTTEFAGAYKIQILTATLTTASDTIVLTAAANGMSEIIFADAHLTAGVSAACSHLQVSYSALTITIASKAAAGTAATAWIDTTVEILVIGK